MYEKKNNNKIIEFSFIHILFSFVYQSDMIYSLVGLCKKITEKKCNTKIITRTSVDIEAAINSFIKNNDQDTQAYSWNRKFSNILIRKGWWFLWAHFCISKFFGWIYFCIYTHDNINECCVFKYINLVLVAVYLCHKWMN